MYDVVIIGGGTAGMTAAIYVARAGRTALVLEEKSVGGQIITTPDIQNYPAIGKISGFEFADALFKQVTELGAEVKYEKAVDIVSEGDNITVATAKNNYPCKAVILATGAKNRTLGVDREQALIGSGISYCATCDGAFFRNRDVAIVGGGNTSVDDALFLANYCKSVKVIHRRDEFRAEKKQVELLRSKENVEFVLDSVVTEINGDPVLKSIKVKNVKTNSETEFEVAALFVAVGQVPDNKDFEDLIELDKGGYIVADESCKTKQKNIFTAGDCRTKTVRQLTTAASDGAIAALAACEYINAL